MAGGVGVALVHGFRDHLDGLLQARAQAFLILRLGQYGLLQVRAQTFLIVRLRQYGLLEARAQAFLILRLGQNDLIEAGAQAFLMLRFGHRSAQRGNAVPQCRRNLIHQPAFLIGPAANPDSIRRQACHFTLELPKGNGDARHIAPFGRILVPGSGGRIRCEVFRHSNFPGPNATAGRALAANCVRPCVIEQLQVPVLMPVMRDRNNTFFRSLFGKANPGHPVAGRLDHDPAVL